jgi:hypothetical protein
LTFLTASTLAVSISLNPSSVIIPSLGLLPITFNSFLSSTIPARDADADAEPPSVHDLPQKARSHLESSTQEERQPLCVDAVQRVPQVVDAARGLVVREEGVVLVVLVVLAGECRRVTDVGDILTDGESSQ